MAREHCTPGALAIDREVEDLAPPRGGAGVEGHFRRHHPSHVEEVHPPVGPAEMRLHVPSEGQGLRGTASPDPVGLEVEVVPQTSHAFAHGVRGEGLLPKHGSTPVG